MNSNPRAGIAALSKRATWPSANTDAGPIHDLVIDREFGAVVVLPLLDPVPPPDLLDRDSGVLLPHGGVWEMPAIPADELLLEEGAIVVEEVRLLDPAGETQGILAPRAADRGELRVVVEEDLELALSPT
jgi:hypothetical protein